MRGPQIVDVMGAQPVATAPFRRMTDREVHQAHLAERGKRKVQLRATQQAGLKLEAARGDKARTEERARALRARARAVPAGAKQLEEQAAKEEQQATALDARIAKLEADFHAQLLELSRLADRAELAELGAMYAPPPYPPPPYPPPPYATPGYGAPSYPEPPQYVPMPVPPLPEPLGDANVDDPLAERFAGEPGRWEDLTDAQRAARWDEVNRKQQHREIELLARLRAEGRIGGEPPVRWEDLTDAQRAARWTSKSRCRSLEEGIGGEPQAQAGAEQRLRAALPPLASDEREVFHAMYRGALVTIARGPEAFRGSLVIEIQPTTPIVCSVILPLELVAGFFMRARERAALLGRYLGAVGTERIGTDDVRRAFEDLGRDETFREITRRVDEVLQHPAVRAVTNAIPIVSQIADVARVASGAARGLGEGGVAGMGTGALKGLGTTQVAAPAREAPQTAFEVRAGLQGGRAAETVPPGQRRAAHELAHLLAVRDPGAVQVTLELASAAAEGDAGARRALGLVRAAKRGAFRRVDVVERVGANPENPWQAAGLYR